jgi:ubiquinone/menaquinone biosynthesis C-methylase UbiE
MDRWREPELMDGPIDAAAHEHALRSLNRIDTLLRVHQRLYGTLSALGDPERMSVADLGSGGGGFLGYLRRRGEGRRDGEAGGQAGRLAGADGGRLLLGVDYSHFALAASRAWHGHEVRGVVADARRSPLADASVDIVTCSLFLHHFDEPDVVAILKEAARVARRGVVVSDLSRSRLALGLTWLTTRAVSRSRVFHVDGVRSVQAAFRARELAEMARRAGLEGARVRGMFPFRLMLVWRKAG